MASPNDNFQLKDAVDNTFKARAKDVSAAQDGSLQIMRHLATPYPVDYGIGGCYHAVFKSGIMAAGLAANSPILAFRNTSPSMNALIRHIKFNAWTLGTGFAAGLATMELYIAKSFTAMDTGGNTGTTSAAKLATSMGGSSAAVQWATTGALTAGTRTLNTYPLEAENVSAPTTAYTPFTTNPLRADLLDKNGGDHPVLLAQNEGLVLQATVPGTGLWSWAARIVWDEVPLTNY